MSKNVFIYPTISYICNHQDTWVHEHPRKQTFMQFVRMYVKGQWQNNKYPNSLLNQSPKGDIVEVYTTLC